MKKNALKQSIEQLAVEAVLLDHSDIPKLGEILKVMNTAIEQSDADSESDFILLLEAMKKYIEMMILRKVEDTTPYENGVRCLQTMLDDSREAPESNVDISNLLKELQIIKNKTKKQDKIASDAKNQNIEKKSKKNNLSEEDKKIVLEFVAESSESLESIEVNLIHLEENPDDIQLINDIFRPFHTIKGVSGFLNLGNINRLAHSVENLLDKAREGEVKVDAFIVDIILESIDGLGKMLDQVESGVRQGTDLESDLSGIQDLLDRIKELNENLENIGSKPIGEIMVQRGDLPHDLMENVLQQQKQSPDKRIGEILVEKGGVAPKQVISALRDQRRFGKKRSDFQVRVDTKKLDTLVDMTGELVIAHSMMRRDIQSLSENDQKLNKNLGQIYQITSTLQKTAMSMRMVPIKNTFHKMLRLVRELGKASGKDIEINIQGADTEIDRNLVDLLYEPLVHMIRNAIDHGIEMPEERRKAGKREQGTISLRAYHRSGNVVIELSDDGSGLDREKIINRAISQNIISGKEEIKDADIYNLIFHPGFSTARQVTEISGRGVGMDVVKKFIEKLRGRVEIVSQFGEGSTFIIRLPLTLAIIEGILVRVGEERYVVPTLSILESFVPQKEQCFTVHGKREMVLYREELTPMVRLDQLFGFNGGPEKPWNGLLMAVEHDGEKRYLLLDDLIGKEEVVIKSLGEKLKNTRGIAGCSIMGDGRVALILDIPDLIEITKSDSDSEVNERLVF